MAALNSTNLASADYREDSKALVVSFTSGGVYEYRGVDKQTYDDLMASGSPGQYFRRNIRDRFPTTRIA